jgi:hypothetical protein
MSNSKHVRMVFAVAVISLIHLLPAPEASAAQVWANCKPTEVAVWNNRVHVRCSVAAPGGIEFFAVQILSGNAADVDRFVNLTSRAITNARLVSILFESTDTSPNAWGCLAGNCRRPIAYVLK